MTRLPGCYGFPTWATRDDLACWSSRPRTLTATARPTLSGLFEARHRSWHFRVRTGRCSGLTRPRSMVAAGRTSMAPRGRSRSSRFPAREWFSAHHLSGTSMATACRTSLPRSSFSKTFRRCFGPVVRRTSQPWWNGTHSNTGAGEWSWPSRDAQAEPFGCILSISEPTTMALDP